MKNYLLTLVTSVLDGNTRIITTWYTEILHKLSKQKKNINIRIIRHIDIDTILFFYILIETRPNNFYSSMPCVTTYDHLSNNTLND